MACSKYIKSVKMGNECFNQKKPTTETVEGITIGQLQVYLEGNKIEKQKPKAKHLLKSNALTKHILKERGITHKKESEVET